MTPSHASIALPPYRKIWSSGQSIENTFRGEFINITDDGDAFLLSSQISMNIR